MRRSVAARVAGVSLALLLASPASPLAAASESAAAQALRQLAGDTSVSRDLTFAELGLGTPLVLGAPDTRRELYLAVPRDLPLGDATLRLDASYLRAEDSPTRWLVSLDGYPVASRSFTLAKGDAGTRLGVDGAPRPSGFLRLGLDWNTALVGEARCAEPRRDGNTLRIEPSSRLSYRYDGKAVTDLATAWAALPPAPVIGVAADHLAADAYDTAWRLGVTLERAGKAPHVAALPKVGDVVVVAAGAVPPGLAGVPSFAALGAGSRHTLASGAEVAALMSLGSRGPWHADLLVVDKAMAGALGQAFTALRAELTTAAPDAVPVFDAWRQAGLDPSASAPVAKQVRLGMAFGQPTILVAADAGTEAATLFSASWRRLAVGSSMLVRPASAPVADASAMSLQALGGEPGTFDVLAHADWNASFDIAAVAGGGRLPTTLVIDLAAAPSAGRTPPVASLFLNDTLIAARQLDATGKAERMTAAIPRYALAARNTIRLSFVRQLAVDRCRETPEAYPVSVLPSSHLLLDKAAPTGDFAGMAARYADGAQVLVPAAYLEAATQTLPRVVRLASLAGVSPLRSAPIATSDGSVAPSGAPFLAVGVAFKDVRSRVHLEADRLVVDSAAGPAAFDASGLSGLAVIEIVGTGDGAGIVFRSNGVAPGLDTVALPARADVVVIGPRGILQSRNDADPADKRLIAEGPSPGLFARSSWWVVPIVAIAFMLGLLVVASRRRRRKTIERSSSPRSRHSTQY